MDGSQKFVVLDSNITFENFRLLEPNPRRFDEFIINHNEDKSINFVSSTNCTNISLKTRKYLENYEDQISDLDYMTSIKQNRTSEVTNNSFCEKRGCSESLFTVVSERLNQFDEEDDSSPSITTNGYETDHTFLSLSGNLQSNCDFIDPRYYSSRILRPMRLFDKNGKPLTDQKGRPLINILGKPLVIIDDKGRAVSDVRGNQVFNCFGESAIFSSTNLYVPPSKEEPGIPLLDVDKKHILWLYDNKGHPLTDVLGRPLMNASGSLMIGISSKDNLNLNRHIHNKMKNLYGRTPIDNFIRKVQIFDVNLQLLTDEYGKLCCNRKIICNKYGMPMCDEKGQQLYFKYGARINAGEINNSYNYGNTKIIERTTNNTSTTHDIELLSTRTYLRTKIDSNFNEMQEEGIKLTERNISETGLTCQLTRNNTYDRSTSTSTLNENSPIVLNYVYKSTSQVHIKDNQENDQDRSKNCLTTSADIEHNIVEPAHKENSQEAIILFDASNKMNNKESKVNSIAFNHIKQGTRNNRLTKTVSRKSTKKRGMFECVLNTLNLTGILQNYNKRVGLINEHGIPVRDVCGNSLYDEFGIPLTGADGIKLDGKTRYMLRMALRHIPVNNVKKEDKQILKCSTNNNGIYYQIGNKQYDQHGRPLYDVFGNEIYDDYGRPLTDAFGRTLINTNGEHLIDLSEFSDSTTDFLLTDVFGRRLYDGHGRPLFDCYGRPRFDLFTNAIYDNYGRPLTDGLGNARFDFLNQSLRPYPDKPLYENSRSVLPKYIDLILGVPNFHCLFSYSTTSMEDVFGGPLFDGRGRPLYNKIGKPLFDKYGRPLYDKDGTPYCDVYGRPMSEIIRQSEYDETLSVVDSMKLLKLNEESLAWIKIKQSQTQGLNPFDPVTTIPIEVIKPAKDKSLQFTYVLTRVTRFKSGRRALEILQAPTSPSAVNNNYYVEDNTHLVIKKRRRHGEPIIKTCNKSN